MAPRQMVPPSCFRCQRLDCIYHDRLHASSSVSRHKPDLQLCPSRCGYCTLVLGWTLVIEREEMVQGPCQANRRFVIAIPLMKKFSSER